MIGTTTDDLKWPWMGVSHIACYLCGSWACCFIITMVYLCTVFI